MKPTPLAALVTTLLLAVVLAAAGSREARAAGPGQFTIKGGSTIDEKNGQWHVKVRIDMAHAPSMMHTPMRFTFSKEAVDERAIMEKGAEPVHHRMVLDTAPKTIVSMDVDFADASGKIFKSTLFEFDLQRSQGFFEAGEYTVALSGPDGDVGSAQKLILKGDNPPVYRGAMDFSANEKGNDKKKKGGVQIQSVSSGIDGGTGSGSDEGDKPAAAPTTTDVAPVGNAPSMVPDSAFNKTAEEEGVKDHPQGCGCVAAGLDASPVGTGAFLVLGTLGALGLAFARRGARRQ